MSRRAPPKYPSDGRLCPSYEAHCCECQHAALGLGRTAKAAARELREDYGWRKVRGFWTCKRCLQNPA